jgi:cytochrome c2
MVLLAFSAYAVAQDEVAEGQKLFDTQCASCHTVKPGANGFGPSLAGVVGTSSIIGFALH